MFNLLRKLFTKQEEPQTKFKVGEEVNVLYSWTTIPGQQEDVPMYMRGTIVSYEIEPAKVWYKIDLQKHGRRTVHESYLEKPEKKDAQT